MEALLERAKPGGPVHPSPLHLADDVVTARSEWVGELTGKRDANAGKMAARLEKARAAHPMKFLGALQAIRDVLNENTKAYLVNEGANALDLTRNTIGMQVPRHRIDSGTWGVMGIGMGYAIAAAVETGDPVVAVEGDSAFGFSGMELETVCRYRLPVVTVILNNSGVYKGDEASPNGDPAPTFLHAEHHKMIGAFGGKGFEATTPAEVADYLRLALACGEPALVDCVIDPSDGTESGNIGHLNPKGLAAASKEGK
jgi:oxalyl-CoA decarboxylase